MDDVIVRPGMIGQTAPAMGSAAPVLKVKPKTHWWMILLSLLIAGGIIYWYGIRPRMATTAVVIPDYISSVVTRRDFTVSVSGSATVQSAESFNVTSLLKGEILDAPFEEGQTVDAGDLLYRIDTSDLEATIEKSRLSVERSRNSYNTILKNIESTKADRAKAAAELTLAAPEGGVVTTLYVAEGDAVNAGTLIAEIIDRENVLLKVSFHSAAAASFYIGQPAEVTVDGAGQTLSGTVTKVAPLDEAGPGGTLVRTVTIQVQNPGTITETSAGTAAVGSAASAAAGTFSYRAKATVTAKRAGTIAQLYIDEGSRVAKDDVVYMLDAEEALSSYDKQLETYENNAKDSALSLNDAELSLQNTIEQLENYTIVSPISGTIIEKSLGQGDNIEGTSSGTMAVIFNMDRLQFTLNIDELDIGKIEVGQNVVITAEALSGQSFNGRVARINYNGRTQSGVTSYPVTVELDSASGLLPGMNISAEILVEEAYNVLCVPINAVQRGNTVLVPEEGAIAADGTIDSAKLGEVPVITGRTNGTYVEITGGLNEGDTIVINTQLSLSSSSFNGNMMGGPGMTITQAMPGGGMTFRSVP